MSYIKKRKIGEETTSGYIVQNKNDSIRLKSTSGAAINAIAEYVISCGGVVFGCEFSDDRVCRHTMATDISDLGKFKPFFIKLHFNCTLRANSIAGCTSATIHLIIDFNHSSQAPL